MGNGVEYQTKIDPRLRRDAKSNYPASDLDRSGRIYWLDHNTGRPRSTPSDNTDESRQDRYVQVFIEVADRATAEQVKGHRRVKHFVNVVDGYCTATVGFDAIDGSRSFSRGDGNRGGSLRTTDTRPFRGPHAWVGRHAWGGKRSYPSRARIRGPDWSCGLWARFYFGRLQRSHQQRYAR